MKVELSHESLDTVLGKTLIEILWCWTYYPSSYKFKPDLSILSCMDIVLEKYRDMSLNILHDSQSDI